MRLRAEEADAALRSERDAFEEVRECLTDHLNWMQIALEEAEACEQEAIADCQPTLKVIKFKKYKKGTKTGDVGCLQGTRLRMDPSLRVKVRILLKVALPLLPWWRLL